MAEPMTVTALLARAGAEDLPQVVDQLVPLVYQELHEMAHRQLLRERGMRALDTTALVHECYLRLVDQTEVPIKNRSYFFGAAARAMRQVLVDAARRRRSLKRGGGVELEPLEDDAVGVDAFAAEILDLDRALVRLGQRHPRAQSVVECRYFAGMSSSETAEALGLSERTVARDWNIARAWLGRELGSPEAPSPEA